MSATSLRPEPIRDPRQALAASSGGRGRQSVWQPRANAYLFVELEPLALFVQTPNGLGVRGIGR